MKTRINVIIFVESENQERGKHVTEGMTSNFFLSLLPKSVQLKVISSRQTPQKIFVYFWLFNVRHIPCQHIITAKPFC